jgi:catechol 2,3-dioxygenase-like lactoylglutathione lyase family enzyme
MTLMTGMEQLPGPLSRVDRRLERVRAGRNPPPASTTSPPADGRLHAMDVRFITSVSVVTDQPVENRRLFIDALGLPLTGNDDYVFSENLNGIKHFGIWPLAAAARACFGIDTWPADRPVPQASIEFEVDDVAAAAQELQDQGYQLLHPARTEPWNQTVARLQTNDGLIVGVCFTPWFHRANATS